MSLGCDMAVKRHRSTHGWQKKSQRSESGQQSIKDLKSRKKAEMKSKRE